MDWAHVPLERVVVDLQPGFACQPTEGDNGIPQLRTNNISTDGRIDLSEVKRVPATDSQLERYALRPRDILFNNTNSPSLVGKTAFFTEEGTYLFSNHMTRVRVAPEIADSAYVARYLHWAWSQGALRGLITQWVNQAAINSSQLASVHVPLPPLSEQRRIVEILDHADHLRRLRAEADAKADYITPALFIKMFGDPLRLLMHPSARPLAEFKVDFQNGFACGDKNVPVGMPHLRMNNIADSGRLDLRLVRTVPQDKDSERYRLRAGDVLFMSTNSKDRIGKACVFTPPDDRGYLFSNHLTRIRTNGCDLAPEFLATYLHLLWERGFFLGSAKRWVNQATISREVLSRVGVPAFEFETQQVFAKTQRCLTRRVSATTIAAERLGILFNSLHHQAFSGYLTASWREAHMKELLQESRQRAKITEEEG